MLRLTGPALFERAFKGRDRRQGRFFTIHRAPNALSHARLGIVISRKTAGNAVLRNQIKRLIREVFRVRQHELAGWDWIVRVKVAPTGVQSSMGRSELESLFLPSRSGPAV